MAARRGAPAAPFGLGRRTLSQAGVDGGFDLATLSVEPVRLRVPQELTRCRPYVVGVKPPTHGLPPCGRRDFIGRTCLPVLFCRDVTRARLAMFHCVKKAVK